MLGLDVLHVEKVTHLGIFGIHVELVLLIAGHLDLFATYYLESESSQSIYLGWIIGHQDQLMNAQVSQNGGTCTILAEIGCKAECKIGLYSIHTLILKCIGTELVDESDATTLLTQVE